MQQPTPVQPPQRALVPWAGAGIDAFGQDPRVLFGRGDAGGARGRRGEQPHRPPIPPQPRLWPTVREVLERGKGGGLGRDALEWGGGTPPPPGRPAYAQPLSP